MTGPGEYDVVLISAAMAGAHLVQAAATGRADAADGHSQPGADLGVRYRRVRGEHSDKPLAFRGQMGERLTQRRMTLGREHFLLGRIGPLIRHVLSVERVDGCVRAVCRAHEAPALPPGGGGEPPGQRGWLADLAQVVHQVQPDVLAHVVGVGVAEPVLAANRPDQRGVALDEGLPRLYVAVSGAGYQVDDHRVITRLVDVVSHRFTWDTGCLSGHGQVLLNNCRAICPAAYPRR